MNRLYGTKFSEFDAISNFVVTYDTDIFILNTELLHSLCSVFRSLFVVDSIREH